ncbi:NAD(P)-binding protein [Francisellaceae bacterium CB300]
MKYIDTIIIGGGISGVSLSNKLNQAGIDNSIFEHKQIGGCIATANYNNFWFEMGAHTIYNSYSDTIELIKNKNLLKKIVTRKKLPFLFVKSNNRIQSIFTNLNWFTLGLSYIKNRDISKENLTVSEYSKKVFGKSNYNNTFKYCFNAVLSQDSVNFPMEYLFKKYPRDTTLPRSFTLEKGLSSLFDNNISNIINEKVISIKKDDDAWIVNSNTNSYHTKNICLATPWSVTEELLKDILPKISSHPNRPTTSKLTSIGIVATKSNLKQIKDLAGLIGKEQFFYSAVSRDIIADEGLRAIVFHCKDHTNNEAILISKIAKLLKINQNQILHTEIKYQSLPKYDKNHTKFIDDLNSELKNQNNLYITGNFFDRLAIENCIRRSNSEFNRIISNNITQ